MQTNLKINHRDFKILKFIKSHKYISKSDLIKKLNLKNEIRIDMLYEQNLISYDYCLYNEFGELTPVDNLYITDLGNMYLENMQDNRIIKLFDLFREKLVDIIVSFITAVLTYFVMPNFIAFISRILQIIQQ